MAVIDFQSTCVSSYRFVNLQQRTCDDEAQRIRGIAIYNESDGRATVEIDELIFWIFSHVNA